MGHLSLLDVSKTNKNSIQTYFTYRKENGLFYYLLPPESLEHFYYIETFSIFFEVYHVSTYSREFLPLPRSIKISGCYTSGALDTKTQRPQHVFVQSLDGDCSCCLTSINHNCNNNYKSSGKLQTRKNGGSSKTVRYFKQSLFLK